MAERADLPEPAESQPAERRVVWLLLAAAVVAVATLGVVLRFGLIGPPDLAQVDDATRPEAAVAILSYRDGERGQCLDVVEVDGEVREIRCRLDGVGPLLGWDERGILVVRFGSLGERLDIVDPSGGQVVESVAFDMRAAELEVWGTVVDVDRSGGMLTVRDEDQTVLWSVAAPDGYWITASARQPDTGDIVMLDAAGRLLVLRPGEREPRVWVEGLAQRYGEIIWQGTPLLSE
jgi:hypothetical protein